MNMQLRNHYQFITVQQIEQLKQNLLDKGRDLHIKGTILLAHEGINMAICGNASALTNLEQYIESLLGITINSFVTPINKNKALPFQKYKVKVKHELIKLGIQKAEIVQKNIPVCMCGKYVEPKHWNELIRSPNTILIDTRNHYEYSLGHFKNALNPQTSFFTEFPEYLHNNFKNKKDCTIAMYCTGGIRCEKASYYMGLQKYSNVYQLQGGILSYFDKIPQKQSLWIGSCFVFDDRIAIGHDMSTTTLSLQEMSKTSNITYHDRHIQYVYKKINHHLNKDTANFQTTHTHK